MGKQEPAELQLVVIGSSAGGIEALSRVVASLSSDFPAPIVIAQHLDPRRPSHLGEILARHSALPIKVVDESAALEDGVIFVIPSNRLVEIDGGELRLRPARPGSVAPSVDLLLETAATAVGPGLTAVILTGTGSDGSAGAWHVKRAGGAVVIENPETALFPSMPRSISPALVDATADLDSIGAVLRDLLAAGGTVPGGREGRGFAALLDKIRDRSGIDFSTYRPATIVRRLRGRMGATGHATIAAYAKQLDTDPAEYARLISSLLIKVTEFFRDPKVFDHLRDHTLPMLIAEARKHRRPLRVWSAGCSTGEEAYSLAIMLAEAIGDDVLPLDVRIFATDIDGAAIAFARRGLYPSAELENVPPAYRERYFARSEGGHEVSKSLRTLMVFGEHDLGARSPFPRIDLILCRNVLIYFNPGMQRMALETFGLSLRDGGRLVLGPSETVAAMAGPYAEEHARFRIYRRVGGPPRLPLSMAKPLRPHRDLDAPLETAIRATRHDVQLAADSTEAAEKLLLDLGLGIVVVDARYDIIRINTAARRMLGIHGLAFDQDFVHLAEVAAARPDPGRHRWRARRQDDDEPSTRSSRPGSPPIASGSSRRSSGPTSGRPGRSRARSSSSPTSVAPSAPAPKGAKSERQLERATVVNRRLLRANDELTALVAQLRIANQSMLQSSEEAQSGREEVETLNEEFQATNEELETLNEELTASVEELRVANEDLAARTEELRLQTVALEEQKRQGEEEHSRLESVLASLGDAVVAVDHEGEALATNPAYDRLFGSADAAIQPEDLAGLPLPEAEWPQQRAARGERFRMEFAVSDPDGSRRWFEAVTEPLTSQDRTWGGVVAIRDISERTMRLSLERLMAAAGHELKTPTAAIHNYLQLVDRHLADGEADKAATYAERALAQTRRLASLIERLLDVSRIQSGQLELLLDVVDLGAVVRSVVDVAQVVPKAPPINVTGGLRPVPVRADPGRLEQVFLNLLANAIEHAPGSGADRGDGRDQGRARRGHRPGPRPRVSRRRTSGRCSMPTPGWATRIGRRGSASACTWPARSSRRTAARSRRRPRSARAPS